MYIDPRKSDLGSDHFLSPQFLPITYRPISTALEVGPSKLFCRKLVPFSRPKRASSFTVNLSFRVSYSEYNESRCLRKRAPAYFRNSCGSTPHRYSKTPFWIFVCTPYFSGQKKWAIGWNSRRSAFWIQTNHPSWWRWGELNPRPKAL